MLWLIVFCVCAIAVLILAIYIITFFFRYACVLCGLPKPSMWLSFLVLSLIWVSKSVAELIMQKVVAHLGQQAGLPPWEAWLIVLMLLLPIDLLISAALHAGLMRIRFGKGIEVWLVQMLMYGSLLAGILSIGAVYLLAAG
jgi:hypothetical protein